MPAHPAVTVITHPLIQHRLTRVRDRNTGVDEFRGHLCHIARLMVYELTRDYPMHPVTVETPLAPCKGQELSVKLTLVPILRAGWGMAEGIVDLIPGARVGHLGIFRDEQTLRPVTYYRKLPPDIAETEVILVDPMLATGGSLIAALDVLRAAGAQRLKILCLVASPEGITRLHQAHPGVPVFTAAIDSHLNERGYIIPGLGDAGDRLYGTA